MTGFPTENGPNDHPASDAAKVRKCLRCQCEFDSTWAGDRVCTGCKRKSSWRQALPSRAHPGRFG